MDPNLRIFKIMFLKQYFQNYILGVLRNDLKIMSGLKNMRLKHDEIIVLNT